MIAWKINMFKHPPYKALPSQIFSQKVNVASVGSKCGSLENAQHQAGGGDKKVTYWDVMNLLFLFVSRCRLIVF